jgi:hypothetical protein
MTSTEARQEGGRAQDLSGKTMAPWTFDVKFPHGTEFTFWSLTFAAGEDGDLKMLPPWATTRAPSSGSIIYVKRFLLRFGSMCKALHLHCQSYLGHPDRDVHPPATHWSIESIVINIDPRPRFI